MQLPIIKNYWKKSSRLPSIFTLFFFLLSVPAGFFVACTFCGTLVGAAVATGAFVAFVLFLFFFFFGVAVFFGFLDASGRMIHRKLQQFRCNFPDCRLFTGRTPRHLL